MITFVIYHVPLPKETVKSSKVLLSFHRMNFDYSRMLDLAFRSAILFHPECRIVLLTSLQHQPQFSSGIADKVEIFRYDVNETQPMTGRMWAEFNYLCEHDFTSHVVVLDSDMLVNANLEDIFGADFDIALTYNEGKTETDKKMPINAGLKLVHSHHREGAIRFFQQAYELCNSDHLAQYRTWWGDQYALIEAVGADNFWKRSRDEITVNDIKIQLLPCDDFNFTPRRKAREIRDELKNKKVLHFRGARKRYMFMYWRLYLSLREKQGFMNRLSALITRAHLRVGMILQYKR